MTEKQLKKLRRADLLEMMLTLVKENDELRKQLANAQKQIDDRMIAIEPVGSLAEAALTLNGVFESAQAACEQYLHNVIERSRNIEEFCDRMERETQEKCNQMLEEAKIKADEYMQNAKFKSIDIESGDSSDDIDDILDDISQE